ncbi:hypothetical protein BH09MYX1_BH09MYX1_02760 [soil metagenome]
MTSRLFFALALPLVFACGGSSAPAKDPDVVALPAGAGSTANGQAMCPNPTDWRCGPIPDRHHPRPKANGSDRDGDGIADDVDMCPDDVEDFDAFDDDDGCPDPDNDRDGIADEDDKCPNEPGPRSNFGCPSMGQSGVGAGGRGFDRDGDGIPDSQDRCPDEPEDKDGFQDADGCPDPDNDGDGIPDVNDMCPNDPETKNGYQDQDGCPDKKPGHP